MTLVHTSFYKITSISFLISIASHIFVAFLICYLKKEKCRPLPFGILATLSFLLANFSEIVFCVLPPGAFLDCRQGSEELQGIFPPSQGPCNNRFATESLQGPCRKALPDLGVSSVPPSGPLLQPLYRKTGKRSKSRPCNTACLVHGEGNGKIKTHPMSCCTWSHVLCRCL